MCEISQICEKVLVKYSWKMRMRSWPRGQRSSYVEEGLHSTKLHKKHRHIHRHTSGSSLGSY